MKTHSLQRLRQALVAHYDGAKLAPYMLQQWVVVEASEAQLSQKHRLAHVKLLNANRYILFLSVFFFCFEFVVFFVADLEFMGRFFLRGGSVRGCLSAVSWVGVKDTFEPSSFCNLFENCLSPVLGILRDQFGNVTSF